MEYEIPDKVSLVVRNGESQPDFIRRVFVEAARLAGMPLLEQTAYADYMMSIGGHLFASKDGKSRLNWINDPSPKDNDSLVSDEEWKGKYGKSHTHTLDDPSLAELTTRRLYYTMNGGVPGSLKELPDVEEITVDLNIVYDPELITANVAPQTKLEYIQQNLKPKFQYWTETFYRIGLLYTVRYTTGTVNATRTEITSGTQAGMVNIFYLNDPKRLWAYAKTETGNNQVFISELKNDLMYDRVICHELGHVFGITGLSGIYALDWINYYIPVANLISDPKINSALDQLKSNSVKYGIDWMDDYRKAPKRIYHTPQIAKLGPNATRRVVQREPTIYDIFRFGARMLKK